VRHKTKHQPSALLHLRIQQKKKKKILNSLKFKNLHQLLVALILDAQCPGVAKAAAAANLQNRPRLLSAESKDP